MKIRQKFGSAFIYFMDGQKKRGRDRDCQYWFYNPKKAFIVGAFGLLGLLGLFGSSGGGVKQAKDFVEQCKQAAGAQS